MVHVLDILGCIAQGPTTESALEATPDVIHTCLRFLL
jgi:predicted RNase H-like HicB family nuclease